MPNSDSCPEDDVRCTPPGLLDEDHFVLNESLFDIVPAQSTTSSPPRLPDPLSPPKQVRLLTKVSPPTQSAREPSPVAAYEDSYAAQYAEFEDWFYNSGSVVIVDKLDD